jgi:Cys-rich protein (TIGR01571 family)
MLEQPLPHSSTAVAVRVIAPSDLPPGYQFVVSDGDKGGQKRVQVPNDGNGVKAGQEFEAVFLAESVSEHNIPMGRWRDDLFSCCSLGCCHAQCCLTYWCLCCALGQVLTRMKLSWIGFPLEKTSTTVTSGQTSAYKILFVLAVVRLVVDNILGELSRNRKEEDKAAADAAAAFYRIRYGTSTSDGYSYGTSTTTVTNIYEVVDTILSFIFFLYAFVVVMRLRAYVRHKYRIREELCTGCEDCCCAYWCAPCVVCQTARHTADYKKYSADLCSETGLAAGVPEVV